MAALAHLVRAEPVRVHGADESADAASAEPINLEAGLFQGLDGADVGVAAGPAAREDDAERPPHEAASDSGNGCRADAVHEMVGPRRDCVEQAGEALSA